MIDNKLASKIIFAILFLSIFTQGALMCSTYMDSQSRFSKSYKLK